MRKGLKWTMPCLIAAISANCATKKSDVDQQWKDVESEKSEARKMTKEYESGKQEKFADKIDEEIRDYQKKLAALRGSAIMSVGSNKEVLKDNVWKLDREISELKDENLELRKHSAENWDGNKQRIEEKISVIEELFSESKQLAH